MLGNTATLFLKLNNKHMYISTHPTQEYKFPLLTSETKETTKTTAKQFYLSYIGM